MTSNFDEYNNPRPPRPGDGQGTDAGSAQSPSEALNPLKRDRFELLSAYLDGEVTATERRQIEEWLAADPTVQRLYARLLKLRQGLRTMPVPPSEQSVEQTVQQVVSRLERRPKRRIVWGGMAVAALFVGALATLLPRTEFSPQMAQSPNDNKSPNSGLMIALDRPVIEIPKGTVSTPVQPSSGLLHNSSAN